MNHAASGDKDLFKSIIAMTKGLPELDPVIAAEYFGYINEILDVHQACADRFEELEKLATESTTHMTYASGDAVIHRGYRCPSPVWELMVGGCKRGRQLVKPQKNLSSYYRYSMDGQDRILKVEQYIDNRVYETEYLIYKQNKIYGITERSLQSLEIYDDAGRMITYITILPDWYSAHRFHNIFHSEALAYQNDGRIATVVSASGTPGLKLLSLYTYRVIYDVNNQIDGFETENGFFKARKPGARRRKSVDLSGRLTRLLDRRGFSGTLDVDAAIAAFEEMSNIKIDTESDDLLFEAGPQNFAGEKLFWLSLVRQYDTPDPDNSEYLQLRLSVLFPPDDRLMPFVMTEWSNGDCEAFFTMIRSCELLAKIRQHGIKPLRYSVTLDET